jgi:hypothetical protein
MWIDLALLLSFVALATTGAIMHWVLPPGSGGRLGGHQARRELLDLSRHDWGKLHFVVAGTMVLLVIVHLTMHWGWIKNCARRATGREGGRAAPPG